MLNEAAVLPRLLRLLAVLVPAPAEIIAVDGGSQDETLSIVQESGFVRLVEHPARGRAAAINRGIANNPKQIRPLETARDGTYSS